MKNVIFVAAFIALSATAPLAHADEFDSDGNVIIDDTDTSSVVIEKREPTVIIKKQPTIVIEKQRPTVVIEQDDMDGDAE